VRGENGEWRIDHTVIKGLNVHSLVCPPTVPDDFEPTALVRTCARVNAGILPRGKTDGPNRGFEARIYSPVDAVCQAGAVYAPWRKLLTYACAALTPLSSFGVSASTPPQRTR
jgi:hypothetical protein